MISPLNEIKHKANFTIINLSLLFLTYFKNTYLIIVLLVFNRRRQWHPTPVLLPGKSHGWRSLEGCSLWGPWGLDMTEQLHFHFSLSCIGERNGIPLQCSCLENPRDSTAWWAAAYGVTQSRTLLKRLGSSSSSNSHFYQFIIGISFYVWQLCLSLHGNQSHLPPTETEKAAFLEEKGQAKDLSLNI